MNKKAELFDAYLKDKKITAFTVDEIKDDPLHTTAFRSHIEVGGARLPTIVILDSSIYAMIRILVAPKALREDNKPALRELMDSYNRQYKLFKYYTDSEGGSGDRYVPPRQGGRAGRRYDLYDVRRAHPAPE